MTMKKVYVGMGGNMGPVLSALKDALDQIKGLPIHNLRVSSFYQTSPLSNIHQPFFVNAVCCFETALELKPLLKELQNIETSLGKIPKPKEAPRPIDLDILFYGTLFFQDEEVQVPHPRWRERLFVLIPLAELEEKLSIPSPTGLQLVIFKELIGLFPSDSGQFISLIDKKETVQ